MTPNLPPGVRFSVPNTGSKKYTAVIPLPDGKSRRVSFGHRDYQQYRDRVPQALGGGRWSQNDHGDSRRRADYRRRHGAQRCEDGTPCVERLYSPAWFSYNFLW